MNSSIDLVVSVVGMLAFVVLAFSRLYISRADRRREMRRLVFVDVLLVISGVELVAQSLGTADLAVAVTFACRGALAAGGIALVATINWTAGSFRASELGGPGGAGGKGGKGGEGAPGQPGTEGEKGWGGRGGAGGKGGAGGPPGEKQ